MQRAHFGIAPRGRHFSPVTILAETVVTSGRKLRGHSFRTLARLTGRLVFMGSRGVRSRQGLGYWYAPAREKTK